MKRIAFTSILKHRQFSTSSINAANKNYKLVIVGSGTGGTATANKFARKLGQGAVAVIEPTDVHYYQPMFTLVGGGIKRFDQTSLNRSELLPNKVDWIKERVSKFDPDNNQVTTESGDTITYEYLITATGLQLNFNQIKGLEEALAEDPAVCSNYSPKTVTKTFPALQAFQEGNVIFTLPATPIKCAGAPQKIMYLADEYLRNAGKRDKANIVFNSSLGGIFGVKKYAEALLPIVKRKNLTCNFRTNLTEVNHKKREATFVNLDTGEESVYEYSFLHAVPPMSAVDAVKNSPLVDETGYVTVDKTTLQHTKYSNVFGIGDNCNLPSSKTAAAAAAQAGILSSNLSSVMNGSKPTAIYDGYTSCPLVTAHNKCVLAEFDFDGEPLETFPFNQAKERYSMFVMKAYMMPTMYWRMLLKGIWNGPKPVRKLLHMGMSR